MYFKEINEVYAELETSQKGLSSYEAKIRLEKYGPNEIAEKEKISAFKIMMGQFTSPIIWILIAATLVSLFAGENVDAAVIAAILVVNAIIGFSQEYRAEKSIDALKKLASLQAVVIRDDKKIKIDAKDICPGDIIILETGEKIPADARLIEVINLQTQEAILTGESFTIKKMTEKLKEGLGIGDRKNMVFSGTIVTSGRGKAIVTETGMNTEIGKIAHLIKISESEITPLQKKLKQLANWLGIITLAIVAIVFFVSLIKAQGTTLELFLIAIALGVAAVPEGLPIVVTISMALGVHNMVKKNALIRKLPSVETLGSTTIICTDKTGTLTKNEMTVTKIFVDDKIIKVSGSGYEPKGAFSEHTEGLRMLLEIGALNNNAKLVEENKNWKIIGDPTEGALIVSAAKAGLNKEILENKNKRTEEIEFDSERKRMTTVHKVDNKKIAYVKGAPDVLLGLCTRIYENGRIVKLTDENKNKIMKINHSFANDALRVLGFAYKELGWEEKKDIENNLTWVGLQGMIDPAREEAKEAIIKCKKAGIKVVMITGDFITTAKAIAKELGIEGKAITGDEISPEILEKEVADITIYARVNTEHKLQIIDALKKKGHIVAMTGDGVNDAPALKKADIGVSMGITGTDVAKEASDIILTDDNFASIVNAIEEGRGVYDNIRKFFALLISGNIGEVFIILLAVIMGLPLPMIAIQILMINLVTDGLPATALGADSFEPRAMERKPRNPKEPIYSKMRPYLIYSPTLLVILALSLFAFFLKDGNIVKAQTVTFLTVALFKLCLAFSCRSLIYPVYKVGIFSNKWLNLAVISSFVAVLAAIYIPALQPVFGTFPLTFAEFMAVFLLSSIGAAYLEMHKLILTRKG